MSKFWIELVRKRRRRMAIPTPIPDTSENTG